MNRGDGTKTNMNSILKTMRKIWPNEQKCWIIKMIFCWSEDINQNDLKCESNSKQKRYNKLMMNNESDEKQFSFKINDLINWIQFPMKCFQFGFEAKDCIEVIKPQLNLYLLFTGNLSNFNQSQSPSTIVNTFKLFSTLIALCHWFGVVRIYLLILFFCNSLQSQWVVVVYQGAFSPLTIC